MRILMISPHPVYTPRGTPISVMNRCRALCALGHEVDLVTYPVGEDVPVEGLRYLRPRVPGFRRVAVGPSWSKLVLDLAVFALAWRVLARHPERYDAVHTHEEAGPLGVLLGRRAGLPHVYDMGNDWSVVLTNYGVSARNPLVWLASHVEAWVTRHADSVLVHFPSLADTVRRRASATPVSVAYNIPLDGRVSPELVDGFRGAWSSDGRPVVLYTGTLEPYQGVDVLVEACASLQGRDGAGVAPRLVLVGGTTEQQDRLRALAADAGWAEGPVLTGQMAGSMMPSALEAADVLVSPRSSGSNTPLKVFGYLRSGKPIVATRISSHTQVLDEHTAVLVEPTVVGLASGIAAALDRDAGTADDDDRRAAAERARARFGVRPHLQAVAAAYRPLGVPAPDAGTLARATATLDPADHPLRVSVIGTGYLGVTHAVCMAELGFDVRGLDVDADKVQRLDNGDLPFHEPGLEPLLRKQLESGRLRFTTSWDEIAEFADVHFICVGTPQRSDGDAADVSQVDAAVTALAGRLHRACLVVGKSTVPAGTASRLDAMIASVAPAGRDHGGLVELAWNPEFLREGFAVEDTLHPDRLVLGVQSSSAEATLRTLYAALIEEGTPVVTCDWATAELVKVAANAFLATKISFINAMSELCEVVGGDVGPLARALALDPRIGDRFLRPGLGFGGGCLPKDIRAFAARARELGSGATLAFLAEIDAVNLRRRQRTVELVRTMLSGQVAGARIALLGAAFKPDSDDIRDSPGLDVGRRLAELGARVVVHDPAANENARRVAPELQFADGTLSALSGADLVLLVTEWAQFRELDPHVARSAVLHPRIVDARRVLEPDRWRDAGWQFATLGVASRGDAR